VLAVGKKADLVILDAPSYVHLAYRPGVPLVRAVLPAYPSETTESAVFLQGKGGRDTDVTF